jgi:hypothetical protein
MNLELPVPKNKTLDPNLKRVFGTHYRKFARFPNRETKFEPCEYLCFKIDENQKKFVKKNNSKIESIIERWTQCGVGEAFIRIWLAGLCSVARFKTSRDERIRLEKLLQQVRDGATALRQLFDGTHCGIFSHWMIWEDDKKTEELVEPGILQFDSEYFHIQSRLCTFFEGFAHESWQAKQNYFLYVLWDTAEKSGYGRKNLESDLVELLNLKNAAAKSGLSRAIKSKKSGTLDCVNKKELVFFPNC